MADTARSDEDTRELFDDQDTLNWKVDLLARWFRESEHAIAFTGAGISTSAGVPDFRSGMNTSLKTGPGAWALRASGKADRTREQKRNTVSTLAAVPTPTHMSLVALFNTGRLKHLVSQNTDGLHKRSGVAAENISELHGNSTLEVCGREQKHKKERPRFKGCGRMVQRDFRVRRSGNKNKQHETGRCCPDPDCGGPLFDTTINFGESLNARTLATAYENADRADLCLALGSSLTVAPASGIPGSVAGGEDYRQRGRPEAHGRLVIVNLQRTPLDDIAALRINATTDRVMTMLMERLGIEIPTWRLERRLRVGNSPVDSEGTTEVFVEGLAADGVPHQICRRLVIQGGDDDDAERKEGEEQDKENVGMNEEDVCRLMGACRLTDKGNVLVTVDEQAEASARLAVGLRGLDVGQTLGMKAVFYGRYGEPALDIQHELAEAGAERILSLSLDLETNTWTVAEEEQDDNLLK